MKDYHRRRNKQQRKQKRHFQRLINVLCVQSERIFFTILYYIINYIMRKVTTHIHSFASSRASSSPLVVCMMITQNKNSLAHYSHKWHRPIWHQNGKKERTTNKQQLQNRNKMELYLLVSCVSRSLFFRRWWRKYFFVCVCFVVILDVCAQVLVQK